MLSGREHFYSDWQAQVRRVVEHGPVLDLGTPRPFNKHLAWLSSSCARPYFTSDIRAKPSTTFTADASAIPLRDGSLGAVICQGVLNYLTEPQRAVDEIWRVLRPGGQAYLSLTAAAPYTEGHLGFQGDVIRFTPASPDALCERFTTVHVMKAGGLAQAAWNYLPEKMRVAPLQRIVNTLDTRFHTNVTMCIFVFATK